MAQVIEAPAPAPAAPRRRSAWRLVLVTAAALVVGVMAGWLLHGDDGSAPAAGVVAGGGEPTDRQQSMLVAIDDFTANWNQGDGAAVTAMFAPGGSVTLVLDAREYFVLDGSLQSFIDRGLNRTNVVQKEPVLLGDQFATVVGTFGTGGEQVMVFEFTKGTETPRLVSVEIVADY